MALRVGGFATVGALGMSAACEVYDESLLVDARSNPPLSVDDAQSSPPEQTGLAAPASTSGIGSGAEPAVAEVTSPSEEPGNMHDPVDTGPVDPASSSGASSDAAGVVTDAGAPRPQQDAAVTLPEPGMLDAAAPEPVTSEGASPSAAGTETDGGLPTPIDAGGADTGFPPEAGVVEAEDPPRVTIGQWSFEADTEGWVLGVSSPTNLAAQSSLSFSDSEGSPRAGALRLQVPFTSGNQKIAVQVRIPSTDLAQLTLRARVMVASGLSQDAANRSTIKLFAKSGDAYLFASGTPLDLVPGSGWVNVQFTVAEPNYVDPSGSFDASDVREVGFELNTGATGNSISGAIVYLDSVTW